MFPKQKNIKYKNYSNKRTLVCWIYTNSRVFNHASDFIGSNTFVTATDVQCRLHIRTE